MNQISKKNFRSALAFAFMAGFAGVMPAQAQNAAPCPDCGYVLGVQEFEKPSESSGVMGAVAGGALGGLLGHQVGKGRGKDVATVAGAVGGAVAGHQVEKSMTKGKRYEVSARFADGRELMFKYDNPPPFKAGDHVRIVNGALEADQR
ncbi:MAG: glycine zipper 2TM domain-containing protein [Rhodocyclaceae bacterium]|nr:glycine zipper 2TM domain-containing protein [Rhodocyclaceae bacterium]MBX3668190.1 glycine zipper 2TM domain-containing protein [Rhodocyclaceae bacterium]